MKERWYSNVPKSFAGIKSFTYYHSDANTYLLHKKRYMLAMFDTTKKLGSNRIYFLGVIISISDLPYYALALVLLLHFEFEWDKTENPSHYTFKSGKSNNSFGTYYFLVQNIRMFPCKPMNLCM
jgi:hypothetical protein